MAETAIQRLGNLAFAGILVFLAVCTAMQFLRTDLDWLDAPLSFYLGGPGGHLVQSVYFLLAVAMALLGAGYYGALRRESRSAAPLLLFVCAGLALCVTAVSHTNVSHRTPTLEGYVHGVAAQTAFLCAAVAMLLQSWWLRGDVRWRCHFAASFALAWLCFVMMWVDGLWRIMPRGIEQKLVIALMVCWLLRAAWWLRRAGADR